MNKLCPTEIRSQFHMGGPRTAIKQTGVGSRKSITAFGLLLLPDRVIETKAGRKAAASFNIDQALEHVAKFWGISNLKNVEMLCEFLHGNGEDLSLVEQLPMIVPVEANALTKELFDKFLSPSDPTDVVSNPRRVLPVVARCTSKAFIKSQSPIYTPAVLSRFVNLSLPNSWTQKGQTT